jgi:hypothetical protein
VPPQLPSPSSLTGGGGGVASRKMADLTHQLNLEGHRHAMSSGKIAAMEKENNFFHDKAADDGQRVMELENKNRLAATQITELHMQVGDGGAGARGSTRHEGFWPVGLGGSARSVKERGRQSHIRRLPFGDVVERGCTPPARGAPHQLSVQLTAPFRLQVESLKEEMLVMRRPDDLVKDEMSRVTADNRRLVHMLERTAEFKRLMDDMSELKDVHYIPLNECLVQEDLISCMPPPATLESGCPLSVSSPRPNRPPRVASQLHPRARALGVSEASAHYGRATCADPYLPERDREVMLSKESYHWVPKEAFELVQTFLERLFPRVPVQPFMMLLLQLNKVPPAAPTSNRPL